MYDRVRAEWRFKSESASLAVLPQGKEEMSTRVSRLLQSESACNNKGESDDSDNSSNVVLPTVSNASARPHSLFSTDEVDLLLKVCKDMIISAPISKSVIEERLSAKKEGLKLLKRVNIDQIVSRIKYERRLKHGKNSLSRLNRS